MLQSGHRKPETVRYRSGSGFSSGEGASASGIGCSQDKQSTTKYHFPGSVNFGMAGLRLLVIRTKRPLMASPGAARLKRGSSAAAARGRRLPKPTPPRHRSEQSRYIIANRVIAAPPSWRHSAINRRSPCRLSATVILSLIGMWIQY